MKSDHMDVGARRIDFFRHLDDLRTNQYDGASSPTERESVFRTAVQLLSPLVLRLMEEFNRDYLDGTGETLHIEPKDDGSGGLVAEWQLSWPAQREAKLRFRERQVPPIRVLAVFPKGWTHGHLMAPLGGEWPLQVRNEEDTLRQESLVRIILEGELHQRIYEATSNWRIVPSYARSVEKGTD
jgi:hypothetical protein